MLPVLLTFAALPDAMPAYVAVATDLPVALAGPQVAQGFTAQRHV